MSRPKEFVCSGQYLTHDWVQNSVRMECVGCGKQRYPRRPATPQQKLDYAAYMAIKNRRKQLHEAGKEVDV